MPVVDFYSVANRGVFFSDEITGNGSSQDTPHSLGRTPTQVFVTVTDNNGGNAVVAEGSHDGTNCKVQLTNGAKYKIFAV